jgi:hypothetical protein
MKKIIFSFIVITLLIGALSPFSVSASEQIGDKVVINGMEATIVDFKDGQPIYQSIIYPSIYSSNSDGYMQKTDRVYNTARTAVSGGSKETSGDTLRIWHNYTSSPVNYSINRSYLYFDTSPIGAYTITAGTLNIYVQSGDYADGESIQIQSGMPTYPHDPLVLADYDLSNYAGNGGAKAISILTAWSYNSITLNATGYGWINTSGWTKYCLRTTGDINGAVPTGNNFIDFYSSEKGVLYSPYLVVTYTATAPVVISLPAGNIATTSATLNSSITDDGGDPTCQIEFGYGLVSQTAVNYALYTTHTSVTVPVSDYDEGDNPYLGIAGLAVGTPYFYRVKITNEFSSIVSVDEQTFTTTAALADMTQFIGSPNLDSISLNWVKAIGATNTLIRSGTDTYPTTIADGTLVYNGAGIFYIHSGLNEGTTYYYSAWGESGGAYSVNAINLVMTTSSEISLSDIPSITTPTGWFQEPNESFLVNLEPFYTVFNGLADSWGMPRGNAWVGLSLFIIILIGLGLYIKFHAPAFALMVMALAMAGFVVLHILPTFMLYIVLILALGAWSTRPQGV